VLVIDTANKTEAGETHTHTHDFIVCIEVEISECH
jgi:hypothetical protein